MVTYLILMLLIGACLYLLYYNDGIAGLLGAVSIVVLILCLIVHTVALCSVKYDYNTYVNQRAAFVETLEQARQYNRPYEAASIVEDLSEWNETLAHRKFKNNHWFFDQYTDDRFNNLESIK